MSQSSVSEMFRRMGARADVLCVSGRYEPFLELDIRRDEQGAYFHVRHRKEVRLEVVDVQPGDRHLLLRAKEDRTRWRSSSAFLCGHDERSWFVAAIPESERAQTVQDAKDALKPQAVWDAIREAGVSPDERDERWTEAFVRQGEWFFLPRPEMEVSQRDVLRHEPIQRGAGGPHVCQFLYRDAGEEVYVSTGYPDGLTVAEYHALKRAERYWYRWSIMRRNARVFVRGAVQHPDHDSLFLWCWHEVVPNRESEASAMQHVAFLE